MTKKLYIQVTDARHNNVSLPKKKFLRYFFLIIHLFVDPMSDEGYKVLSQSEEKTYGATMADHTEGLESQTQDTTGNGQVIVFF